MKLNVKFTNNISTDLRKRAVQIRKIPDEAYKVFVEETPVRKGNARRNTKLKGKNKIVADYAYADKLNEGYSKQSPKGMTEPTVEFIERRFNNIMSGK